MTDYEQISERTSGGLLGKVSGRAKQLVGSAFGNADLDREANRADRLANAIDPGQDR